jgi:mycothiol synthase
MAEPSSILIQHPPRERWGSVINLALSHRPAEERIRLTDALLQQPPGVRPDAGFDGLREARCHGQMVAAALAVLQSGQSALVYQPRLLPDAPETARTLLNQSLDQFLIANRVVLAQEVLAIDALEDAARSRSAGYHIEVELHYLAADQKVFPTTRPTSELTFEPYTDEHATRLAKILELTYLDTLDCPELNGVRSPIDTIAGYRATGEFRPGAWSIVQHQGEDIGCVLLAFHPPWMAELIYMGLIPQARGRGWGRALTEWALWTARQMNCAVLSVAVDGRNTPARRTYQQAQFAPFDQRRVMLRTSF